MEKPTSPVTIPLYRGWQLEFTSKKPSPRIERRRETRPVRQERRRSA